jgi:hypothetical protein
VPLNASRELRPVAAHGQHDQLQQLPQDQVSERQDHAGQPVASRSPTASSCARSRPSTARIHKFESTAEPTGVRLAAVLRRYQRTVTVPVPGDDIAGAVEAIKANAAEDGAAATTADPGPRGRSGVGPARHADPRLHPAEPTRPDRPGRDREHLRVARQDPRNGLQCPVAVGGRGRRCPFRPRTRGS